MRASILLLACGLAVQTPAQRPRDPWVFRCVLDGRARVAALALSNDLWAAYDASSCALYKAWKGGVRPESAASADGTQVACEGLVYVQGPDGDPWRVTTKDGKSRSVRARWRGYVLAEGGVRLQYELALDDGVVVRVEETPECVRPEKLFDEPSSQAPWLTRGLVGLRRTFKAVGIPEGTTVSLAVEADCAGWLPDRMTGAQESELRLPDGSKGRHVSGRLPLDAATPGNDVMLFFRPAAEARGK